MPTSRTVSMLEWFLYFKITLRIGSETFSNRVVMGPVSRIFKVFTIFEKIEFSDSAILLSSEITSHFQLTSFALLKLSCTKEKVSLFSEKFSYHWHLFHLNCYNNFSSYFSAVKRNNFVVMCIAFCFHQFFLLKTFWEA